MDGQKITKLGDFIPVNIGHMEDVYDIVAHMRTYIHNPEKLEELDEENMQELKNMPQETFDKYKKATIELEDMVQRTPNDSKPIEL